MNMIHYPVFAEPFVLVVIRGALDMLQIIQPQVADIPLARAACGWNKPFHRRARAACGWDKPSHRRSELHVAWASPLTAALDLHVVGSRPVTAALST